MKLKTNTAISILILLFSFTHLTAQIRYVSKTGSSTPPYTSWATASDSIQKCIDICNDGDTVIVGNGVYRESLVINAKITLIGSSMDSCVIEGRDDVANAITTYFELTLKGFTIIGRGIESTPTNSVFLGKSMICDYNIYHCRLSNAYVGIEFRMSSGVIDGVIITNVMSGVNTYCFTDTCRPKLKNSVILLNYNARQAWNSGDGGEPTFLNNIIAVKNTSIWSAPIGILIGWKPHTKLTAKNNLFMGCGIYVFDLYTVWTYPFYIINNVFIDGKAPEDRTFALRSVKSNSVIRNNIFVRNARAVQVNEQPDIDYNIFWENKYYDINSPYQLGENDINADPMFMKDTSGYTLQADYRLQMNSPGIDKGDPEILDVDGTRSDIGMYGGPGGEAYTYIDLPPRTPSSIEGYFEPNGQYVKISWKMNSEADFDRYVIHRSLKQGFIPDSSNMYIITDTSFFRDSLRADIEKIYYRVVAVDKNNNESNASEEIVILVTGVEEKRFEIVSEYRLEQNFPNPFNPSTTIGYRLKEEGYVKIMVYNIQGELLTVLVNETKPAGYHEVEFVAENISSGIYLYRIEIIGRNNIPVFMDMKKMLYIK